MGVLAVTEQSRRWSPGYPSGSSIRSTDGATVIVCVRTFYLALSRIHRTRSIGSAWVFFWRVTQINSNFNKRNSHTTFSKISDHSARRTRNSVDEFSKAVKEYSTKMRAQVLDRVKLFTAWACCFHTKRENRVLISCIDDPDQGGILRTLVQCVFLFVSTPRRCNFSPSGHTV